MIAILFGLSKKLNHYISKTKLRSTKEKCQLVINNQLALSQISSFDLLTFYIRCESSCEERKSRTLGTHAAIRIAETQNRTFAITTTFCRSHYSMQSNWQLLCKKHKYEKTNQFFSAVISFNIMLNTNFIGFWNRIIHFLYDLSYTWYILNRSRYIYLW